MKSLYFFAVFAAWCFVSGCGSDSGLVTYTVSGFVTFQGEPVGKGSVLLLPKSEELHMTSGNFHNGSYSLEAEAGEYLVQITGVRAIPGKFTKDSDGNDVPVLEQYIPKTFNSNSELTIQVGPDATGSFDFDL
ncbi:hypothetical protein [Bremerella alba]|uniref:Lipoprotein n=1 Tax=Bremerella alba TaxID=980252 RepID=A0A7V9A9V3_9BACT|nr:hypothetical protein [Bremerella alba]MBA2117832.1 hypothetical protein [Bremerella alba]